MRERISLIYRLGGASMGPRFPSFGVDFCCVDMEVQVLVDMDS